MESINSSHKQERLLYLSTYLIILGIIRYNQFRHSWTIGKGSFRHRNHTFQRERELVQTKDRSSWVSNRIP
jgi:hypothetical protein